MTIDQKRMVNKGGKSMSLRVEHETTKIDKIMKFALKHNIRIALVCAALAIGVTILFWCLVGAALVKYIFS